MFDRTKIIFGATVLAIAGSCCPVRAGEDAAALIKRQSQEFSDASASGNATVLGRLLDDKVLFMNENGTLSTKNDIVQSAGPPPSGASQSLVQTDWHLQVHGSVAVSAFTDVSTVQFHGQTLTAKYRSTEVWLNEPGGWKMISSQTIALGDDPPAVTLPATVLDEYVGVYSAGPGYSVAIARDGTALKATVNGGQSFPLEAEVKDVFFMPGQPRVRRIFERDASGSITGFVSRREGHDIALKRVS